MQDGTDRTIGRVRLSPSGIRQCAGQCAATRDEPTVIYPGRCLQSGLHRADAPHQAEAHLEWHHSCVSALWAWHYTPCSHRPHMHMAPLHTRPYIDFRRQCLRLSVCSATVASQDTHMSGTSSGATTERDSDWTALSIELPEDSGRTTLAHKLLGSVAPLSYPCPDALVGSARPDAGRASRPGGRYGFKGSVAMPQQVWARHCTVTLGSISVFWRRHSHRVGGALFGFTGAPDYLLSTWMDGLATDFRVEAGSTAGLADVPPGFSSCSSGRASSSMLACPLAQSLHPFVHVNILLLHLSSLSIILPAAH